MTPGVAENKLGAFRKRNVKYRNLNKVIEKLTIMINFGLISWGFLDLSYF